MVALYNIERSGFRRGVHVGYSADGGVWRIFKTGKTYTAVRLYDGVASCISGRTLGEISEKLRSRKSVEREFA